MRKFQGGAYKKAVLSLKLEKFMDHDKTWTI